jgi:hypothetical protein
MSADEVAGLLVLLGVVGVLAAIVGNGIAVGPVKFPRIPSSRQKLLAAASAVVIFGGVWWVVQQGSGNGAHSGGNPTQSETRATGRLRLALLPAPNEASVGETVTVGATVYDSLGQQLGNGQCLINWSDRLSQWTATTGCIAKVSERSVSKAGVHVIVAKAEGTAGVVGAGEAEVRITVR